MVSDIKILVVDDEPDVLLGTSRILKKAGYSVIEVETGEAALLSAREHLPDLILLDMVLPDIDGNEVCRILKNDDRTSDIFIAIISGKKTASDDQSLGLEIGADEYIVRPIANRELLARIHALLRLKHAEKELEKYQTHLEELVQHRTEQLHREIEDRKRAEHARAQTLSELRATLDATIDGIIVVSLDGKINAYSKRFVKIWNMPVSVLDSEDANQALAHILDQILDPDSFSQKVKRLFANLDQKSSGKLYLRDKQSFEFYSRPQKLKDDIVGRVWGFRDVTQQEQTNQNLLDSEQRSYALANASFEAIFFSDKGICIDQNSVAERMFGYSQQEAIGRHGTEWILPEDREIVKNNILGDYEKPYEVTAIRKDGTTFPAEIQGRMIEYMGKSIRVTALRDITVRKEAENALFESEERYRILAETASNYTYSLSLTSNGKFNVDWVGGEFNKLTGYTVDIISNLEEWLSVVHQDDHPRIEQGVARLMSGKPNTTEYRLRTKNGHELWLQDVAKPVLDKSGKSVIRVIGAVKDVSERKKAEKAIVKERDFISKVLYWIDSLVVVIDIEGYVISFNRASEQLSGFRFEDLKGKPFWETLLAPDEREGVQNTIKDVIHKNFPKDFRNHWVTKTGETRLIQWHNSDLRREDGSIEYILCTGLDITERQKAETALKESEAKYRELVENANSIILRVDIPGNITFINEYAEKFFGYKPDEIIGKNALDTILPKTDSSGRDLETLVSNIVKYPENFVSNENENRLRNGQRVWIAWTNRAIYDQKGDIKEILCIGNDITQQKILENELRQSHKIEALGTLAGGIAHEFNNILGIIIGNTELAIDDVPEWNPAKDCLEEIRTASLRAKDVVRQIMSFSRKTPATRKPIQISAIIQESLKLMRATIPINIEIHQEILCKGEMILANPTEINQILMNLCSNSVHAMEGDTGVLKVRLETTVLDGHSAARYNGLTSGEYVKLTVKDSGSGIDSTLIGLVFDPYFTTKDVDKGLGMGLAVVYGIVKKHDGAIRVNSKVGQCTTVEVLFPITKETTQIEKGASNDLPRGTERILFVEDEASLVKMVTQMLGRQGYEVMGKTSPTEALKLFQEESEKFDLVITDMAMPDMTGDRLAQELIKIRPTIPVIICTGHSDRMNEEKAIQSGIAAYTMKPLVKTDLVNTVRRVLDKSKGLVR